MTRLKLFLTVFGCLSAIASHTVAQEINPAAEQAATQVIEVSAVRSPLEIPYKRAYEATRKFNSAAHGKAQLVYRLRDKNQDTKQPLRLTVEYADKIVPIPLDERGTFVLVPDDQAAEMDAKFVINRKAKTMGVSIDLRPTPFGEKTTMGALAEAIQAGRAGRAALLPWYARIVTPTIKALRVCAASPDFAIQDEHGSRAILPTVVEKNEDGKDRFCRDFDNTPDNPTATVTFPAGATFSFAGTAF